MAFCPSWSKIYHNVGFLEPKRINSALHHPYWVSETDCVHGLRGIAFEVNHRSFVAEV